MNNRVYIETSIVSYLTARRIKDLIILADQQTTIDWWNGHRSRFLLCTPEAVLEEARQGDPDAAAKRLVALDGLALLQITQAARQLAKLFIERKLIPASVLIDALHVAVATIHGTDFLLTWNCKHIANAEVARRLDVVCRELGYRMPTLCTPKELMGD